MTRATFVTLAVLSVVWLCAPRAVAQATDAPATRPAPFIPLLPEPNEPETKPAPVIPPLPEPKPGPTTEPAAPVIPPIAPPPTVPTTRPSTAPTTRPAATLPAAVATQPAGVGADGYSPWLAAERGRRCVNLAFMPAEVRDFWLAHCTTRGRILAERAAREDAVARLARRLETLSIAPDLTVRKFLKSAGPADANAERFLKAATVQAVRYKADLLVVQVRVEVRPRAFFASLLGWAKTHRAAAGNAIERIEAKLLHIDDKPLAEVGAGVAPNSEMRNATPELRKATTAATQPSATITAPVTVAPTTRPAPRTTAPAAVTVQPTTQPAGPIIPPLPQ